MFDSAEVSPERSILSVWFNLENTRQCIDLISVPVRTSSAAFHWSYKLKLFPLRAQCFFCDSCFSLLRLKKGKTKKLFEQDNITVGVQKAWDYQFLTSVKIITFRICKIRNYISTKHVITSSSKISKYIYIYESQNILVFGIFLLFLILISR